jgi:hypothetical protein
MTPTIVFTPKDNDLAAFFIRAGCSELEHEAFSGFLKENGVTVFNPVGELDTFMIQQDITQEEGDKLASEFELLVGDLAKEIRKV